jgi:hypothetical protein
MAQRLGQITNSNALLLLAILGAFNFQFPFCVNDIAPAPALDFSLLTSTREQPLFPFFFSLFPSLLSGVCISFCIYQQREEKKKTNSDDLSVPILINGRRKMSLLSILM